MNAARLAYQLVHYSGLPFLFREVLFRRGLRIIVLHDPGAKELARALGFLKKRYNIIPLADVLSGRALPPKPLVITLDDGHIGNRALLDTFKTFGVRPTIFLCAGIVGTKRRFWFLHAGLNGSSEVFKRMPDHERLRALENLGFFPEREYEPAQALQLEHIEAMKDHVDFQSHGTFHACLPNCTEDGAASEIAGSKNLLEPMTGRPITAFAFPNGDYCPRDIGLVQRAGYRCAVTVDQGINGAGADPFRLKRLSVDDTGDLYALSAKVSGVWCLLAATLGRRRLSGFRESPMSTSVSAAAAAQISSLV